MKKGLILSVDKARKKQACLKQKEKSKMWVFLQFIRCQEKQNKSDAKQDELHPKKNPKINPKQNEKTPPIKNSIFFGIHNMV